MKRLKSFIFTVLASLLVLAAIHCIIFGVNSLVNASSCTVFTWSNILDSQDIIVVTIITSLYWGLDLIVPSKWVETLSRIADSPIGKLILSIGKWIFWILFAASCLYQMFFNLC